MTEEPSPVPIARELQDAFRSAIAAYDDWRRGQPEPAVSLNQRPVTISAICERVMNFEDAMPEGLWLLLLSRRGVSGECVKDHSYGSGARYLAQAIKERQELFSRPDL